MAASDARSDSDAVEAAIQLGGLLLRGVVYGTFAAFADGYDCGRALLTGVFAGDLAATVLAAVWRGRDCLLRLAGELLVLALVFAWVRSSLVWPDDLSQRAILGLAAFGAFAGRTGGEALTRFGPSEH